MCRCLGGCSHAMSNNEEQAWEEWRSSVTGRLVAIRAACEQIAEAQWAKHNPGKAIADALARVDEASQAIFNLRDGPERPE